MRRQVRRWALQWPFRLPVLVERGEPLCAPPCGLDREAGEHEPVEECWGRSHVAPAVGKYRCHDPAAHHPYRPAPLLERRAPAEELRWTT